MCVRRHLFNFVAAMSLVLCLVTAALWVRGVGRSEGWYFKPLPRDTFQAPGDFAPSPWCVQWQINWGNSGVLSVQRQFPDERDSWTGNFQPGLVDFRGVFDHPDGKRVVVVAGGTSYVVSPATRTCSSTFGGQIGWCCNVPDLGVLALATLTAILTLDRDGTLWQSRRISWDGFSDLRAVGTTIVGRAHDVVNDEWHDFQVDLTTRAVTGGAYR
jgi:hypothetical protein